MPIAYRNSESEEAQAVVAGGIDNVRWDLLSDTAKGPTVWASLARVLLRHGVFSVEQLSSTVSEAGTNFTSDKRLGQSFYNRLDYVADRIIDESEIRRGKQFPEEIKGERPL